MDANLLWAQVTYTFTASRRNRRRKSQLLFLRFISRSELPNATGVCLPSLTKVTSHYSGTRLLRLTTLKIIDCEFRNLSNSYQSYHVTECMCHMMLLFFFFFFTEDPQQCASSHDANHSLLDIWRWRKHEDPDQPFPTIPRLWEVSSWLKVGKTCDLWILFSVKRAASSS